MTGGSVLLPAQSKPSAWVRVVCFPHAGGAPVVFFPWNRPLGPEIECVGVQYPGRAQRWREPALLSIDELVEEFLNTWEEPAEKTFAFYGHSFGGLVAFEVARSLRRAGMRGPEWLFVAACRPPQLGFLRPPIHGLPDDDFLDALESRYGGIPAQIRGDRELMNLFLEPLRADLTAYERYRMEEEAALDVPVTAFAGADDTAASAACMQGWSRHTTAAFELKVLPGGHFLSLSSQKAVTDWIRTRLLDPERPGRRTVTDPGGSQVGRQAAGRASWPDPAQQGAR